MLKTGVVPGLNKVDPEKLLSKGLVFAYLSGLPTACHLIASRQPTAAASIPTELQCQDVMTCGTSICRHTEQLCSRLALPK